jgi:hypothetical protein
MARRMMIGVKAEVVTAVLLRVPKACVAALPCPTGSMISVHGSLSMGLVFMAW